MNIKYIGKPAFTLAEVFLPPFAGSRKHAFTLAEVLITLAIIGVVAAMTLPTLIQKHQDKELISRTKKVWADINNSLLLVQKDYGVIGDNGFLFNENDNSQIVAQNWAKYFSGAKVCSSPNDAGCEKYYYDVKYAEIQLDADRNASTYNEHRSSRIILQNGAIINVISNQSGCELKTYTNPDQTGTYESSICANIYFDVNGTKSPNQFGRDNYWFWVYKDKLEINSSSQYGGENLINIISGKDLIKYTNYTKGQHIE